MINHTPPHSIEAEEAILGGILLDQAAIANLTIPVDAFYVAAHRKIYSVMQKLVARQLPPDLYHVADALGDEGLTAIGGMVKLTQLLDRTISALNIDRFEALVIQKWERRKLITLCRETLDKAADPTLDWEEVKAEANSKLTEAVASKNGQRGLVHISETLVKICNELEQGVNPAIPTGLNFLDQCLGGGLRGGEFTVVAGRPSMGKSFFATNLARIFAEQGPVAIFSLEMDRESIVKRIAAADAGIRQTWLTANTIPPDKLSLFLEAYDRCARLPIYVDDTPGDECTPHYIQSECHRIYRKHEKLSLILVDYIQLIGDQSSGNRANELGYYTSALKSLSKKFDCPVVGLSQISRGVESRTNKRPLMSDVKGSGAIEQDADVVMALYRDEYYNPDTPDQGILELILTKNRHGKCVTAKAEFDPEIGTITNFVNYSF